MRISLPWWLNPWREARLANATSRTLIRRNGDLRGTNDRQDQQILVLAKLLDESEQRVHELSLDHVPEGHLGAQAQPEFVLIGIDRGPGLGKRLVASRDTTGARFGMTEMDNPPPRWVIRAVLAQPLMIDRKDYATALDHMRDVWPDWDREAAQDRARTASRWQRGGSIGRGQPVIQPYTGDAAS